jgi:hypothetical protein
MLELAEAAAERDVLLGRQVLVSKEYDLVLMQRVDNRLQGLVVDIAGQVDASDFRAEGAARSCNTQH